MELVYLFFIIFYVLLLWSMKQRWHQTEPNASHRKFRGKTAILIPFRDEGDNLPDLLINLDRIVPPEQEVIFIDDASTDGSVTLISAFLREKKHDHWVLLENTGIGKKAALTTGVNFTQAEIIVTTDADCTLRNQWVEHLTRAFCSNEIQLVAGPVMTVARPGFFFCFQQIEWASILLTTKYLFSKGAPLMCSGANLAYRKSAFTAVEGYTGNDIHPSGDDQFLLKKVIQKYGVNSATYLQGEQIMVSTQPQSTWAAFLQQRVRWAGKWRFDRSVGSGLSAILAFSMALLEISTLLLLLGSPWAWLTFIVFWTAKVGIETHVLGNVLKGYGLGQGLSCFIRTSFLHPAYVLVVGLKAVTGKYSWKGRSNTYND